MNDATSVFRRLGSMGWLALAGVPPDLGPSGVQISERVLELADLARQPYVITPDRVLDPKVETFIEDLEILLGVEIQVVNPAVVADEALQELWLNTGIMVMTGGTPEYWLELIGKRLFRLRPQEILAEGSVLFAFDASASIMGPWRVDTAQMSLDKGLGWILGGIVIPTNTDPAEIAAIRNHLEEQEGIYALGLPDEAVIALGPQDEVEVWSEKPPVLLLGKGWQD